MNNILIQETFTGLLHNAGLLYNKGSTELKLKRYEHAIKTLEEAKNSFNPDEDRELYIYILNNLGSAYHSLKKLPEAKNTFKEIIEFEPNFHMSYYNLGLVYNEEEGDLDNAIKLYDKAIEKKRDYFDAIYNKACALYQKAEKDKNPLLYQEAIRELDKAIPLNTKFSDSYHTKGLCFIKLDNNEEAEKYYKIAIEKNNKYAQYFHNLGYALEKLGKFPEALKAATKAVELDDTKTMHLMGVANLQLQLNEYEESIVTYEKILFIDSKYTDAWNNKGLAHEKLKQNEESLKCFNKVIKLNSSYKYCWYNKGLALYHMGRNEDSLIAFENEIKVNPKSHRAWNNKGVCLGNLKRFSDAVLAYEEAIEVKSDFDLPYTNIAGIQIDLGDTNSALANIEKAIQYNNEFSRNWYLKGQCELDNNENEKASKSFKKSIELEYGNLIYILWDIHSQLLTLQTLDSKVINVNDKRIILNNIRRLERIEDIPDKNTEIYSNIVFYAGVLHLKINDIFNALLKFEAASRNSSEIQKISNLYLGYLWNFKIRPSIWRWWLSSPQHTNIKRLIFITIMIAILLLLLFTPLIPRIWCYFEFDFCNLLIYNLETYLFTIIILIFFILLPRLEKIKFKDIEFNLNAEPEIDIKTALALSPKLVSSLVSSIVSVQKGISSKTTKVGYSPFFHKM